MMYHNLPTVLFQQHKLGLQTTGNTHLFSPGDSKVSTPAPRSTSRPWVVTHPTFIPDLDIVYPYPGSKTILLFSILVWLVYLALLPAGRSWGPQPTAGGSNLLAADTKGQAALLAGSDAWWPSGTYAAQADIQQERFWWVHCVCQYLDAAWHVVLNVSKQLEQLQRPVS